MCLSSLWKEGITLACYYSPYGSDKLCWVTFEELLIVSLKSSSFWSRESTCWAKEDGEDSACQTLLFLLGKKSTMTESQDKLSQVHLVPSTLHHTLGPSVAMMISQNWFWTKYYNEQFQSTSTQFVCFRFYLFVCVFCVCPSPRYLYNVCMDFILLNIQYTWYKFAFLHRYCMRQKQPHFKSSFVTKQKILFGHYPKPVKSETLRMYWRIFRFKSSPGDSNVALLKYHSFKAKTMDS